MANTSNTVEFQAQNLVKAKLLLTLALEINRLLILYLQNLPKCFPIWQYKMFQFFLYPS